MIGLPRSVRILLFAAATDMGKGHDGLCALVRDHLGDDPFSGNLFVFLGKRQDRCKILWWEAGVTPAARGATVPGLAVKSRHDRTVTSLGPGAGAG